MRPLQIGAIAAIALVFGSTPLANAADTVLNPFGDQAARVIQGYNGGTHQGRSQYALDLVLAGGGTSGAPVVSPVDGRVVWSTGNGCVGIAMRDSNHSVTLCHVAFTQSFGRGAAVARGQVIGTVGAAGTLGNNGTPHVHLELHRGGGGSSPVAFSVSAGGLELDGLNAPSAPVRASVAAAPAPAPKPQPAPAPAPKPQAAPASKPQAAPAPKPEPSLRAASAAPTLRAAVVEGTESCLNVRASPSADAPIQTCLPDGSEVTLASGGSPGWLQIPNSGWASAEFLRLTTAVVNGTSSCLNVRETPSTDALVVGCLAEGSSVSLTRDRTTAEGLDWIKIATDAGGWVAAAFVG